MAEKQEFSKYERARIIGARGLQISMDAPLLMEMETDDLDEINFDPLRIAEKELESGVLPISVNKPMPVRSEESIEKIKVEESKVTDAEKIKAELEEEKDIMEGGEMKELAENSEEPEVEEALSSDGEARVDLE
ncbi:DNA-directed RNA polymerase subunit K [archaeon]|jgi:DNA-directed RNA polymerase subunit K|nr:DNA-directed RNA polymerase subunit K [archaeon]MBT6182851.1 DNA-directed RNA polymerase subunit K [archaeon]MBT6606811.1 DNA-directed RNA polymerase subunit K [archaeon]MBT7251716.1 DNA-directed RNA polymerase subunit K [archaeon]MBT7660499.1 DNA-directed RNA polymerase subunit K [archaeon]